MNNKEQIINRIAIRDSVGDEQSKYQTIIKDISKSLSDEISKNKRLLFITGAGVSSGGEKTVPGMRELLNKLEALVDNYLAEKTLSQEFGAIYKEYKDSKSSDNQHDSQSKLLTYIQNAYMQKNDYVQSTDSEALQKIWSEFVTYLLGRVKDAEPTEIHKSIAKMMIEINESDHPNNVTNQAIVLTTNFDNMLQKYFKSLDKNFYPILDRDALNQYYTSSENDNSYIEIQSRGDVFWAECSGRKNRTCPNRKKQILLPEDYYSETPEITCPLCGSKALVYFAFPGTKEKDAEMATVVDGLWKFVSTSISTIIIVGSSLDYDPVLVEFMRELSRRYSIRFVYISRYKNDDVTKRINEKKATEFLFGSGAVSDSYWLLAEDTNKILDDILNEYRKIHDTNIDAIENKEVLCGACQNIIKCLFNEKCDSSNIDDAETIFRASFPKNASMLDIPELKKLKNYSQLGMKTYWLRKNGDSLDYKLHTRYKHSLGVMVIATYIYLKKKDKPSYNEMTFLQLAALLHDIGHLPYSHLMEEVFNEFGWKLSSSDTGYSHEQNTKILLEKMYNKTGESNLFKDLLDKTKYTCNDLQRLISGEFGVGYLDALINSPIDCDKIEYLFTDTLYTRNDTRYKLDDFLREFVCEDLKISSTGCFLISGKSTRAFLKLINLRGDMYENTYFRSGLRFLESCTKLIIRTYFSYICAEDDIFTNIVDPERYASFKDLSECKISKAVQYLENKEFYKKGVCEKAIIEDMHKQIEEKYCNADRSYSMISIKSCLDACKNDIVKTTLSNLSTLETSKIRIFEVNSDIDKNKLRGLIKNLYLRFPGVVLIDYIESKSSFSFGRRDSGILRSDGTSSPNENIMIKDIKQVKGYKDSQDISIGDAVKQVNNELKYSTHSYIYLHRITDNRFSYMQAEDLIIDELRKDGIIDV